MCLATNCVQGRAKLGAVLPEGPRDLAAGPDGRLRMQADLGEDLRPELGLVAVDHDVPDEPAVHHLEEVLVLEGLGGELEADRRLAGLLELRVQAQEALVIAARLADEDLPAGQVLRALEGRRRRAAHDDLVHPGGDRVREVHLLAALVGDGQVGRRDVPAARHQPRDELVPAHRDEDHVHPEVSRLQPAVEIVLEGPHAFVGRAALAAPVDEVEGLAVDDEDADPPLARPSGPGRPSPDSRGSSGRRPTGRRARRAGPRRRGGRRAPRPSARPATPCGRVGRAAPRRQ